MSKKDRTKRLKDIPLRSSIPEVFSRARDEMANQARAELNELQKEYTELCKTTISLSDVAALVPDKSTLFSASYVGREDGLGRKLTCTVHFELDADELQGDNKIFRTVARMQSVLERIDVLRFHTCFVLRSDDLYMRMRDWLAQNATPTHDECKAKIAEVAAKIGADSNGYTRF